MRINGNLDMDGNELRNPRIHRAALPPANPEDEQFWWDTSNKNLKVWNAIQGKWYVFLMEAAGGGGVGGDSNMQAYQILVNDWNTSDWDGPSGWTIGKSGTDHLLVTHGLGRKPILYSVVQVPSDYPSSPAVWRAENPTNALQVPDENSSMFINVSANAPTFICNIVFPVV